MERRLRPAAARRGRRDAVGAARSALADTGQQTADEAAGARARTIEGDEAEDCELAEHRLEYARHHRRHFMLELVLDGLKEDCQGGSQSGEYSAIAG